MPRFNIYIRNVDLDKWKAIKDKPAFIHYAVNKHHNKEVSFGTSIDMDTNNKGHVVKTTLNHSYSDYHGKPNSSVAQLDARGVDIAVNQDRTTTVADMSMEEAFALPMTHAAHTYGGVECPLHPMQTKGQCMIKGCKYGRGKK